MPTTTPRKGTAKPERPEDVARSRKALGRRLSQAFNEVATDESRGELVEAMIRRVIWDVIPGKQKKAHVPPAMIAKARSAALAVLTRRTKRPNPHRI